MVKSWAFGTYRRPFIKHHKHNKIYIENFVSSNDHSPVELAADKLLSPLSYRSRSNLADDNPKIFMYMSLRNSAHSIDQDYLFSPT